MALTVSNVTNIPKFGKSGYSRRKCPSPYSCLIWLSTESPILAADFIHQLRRVWFSEMELDFISSEKAEGTAHTLLANPFKHMSHYGLEVMSSCAKIFGQGNLTAALCLVSLSLQWLKRQGSCCPDLKGFFYPSIHPSPIFHPLSWSLISGFTHRLVIFCGFFFFMSAIFQMCVPFPHVAAFSKLVLLCMHICDSETLGDV